jgi:hypothetical protein
VAATAQDLDLPAASPAPLPEEEDLGPHPSVARMVSRIVGLSAASRSRVCQWPSRKVPIARPVEEMRTLDPHAAVTINRMMRRLMRWREIRRCGRLNP